MPDMPDVRDSREVALPPAPAARSLTNPVSTQVLSLYGRRSGMTLQGGASPSGGDTMRLVRSRE